MTVPTACGERVALPAALVDAALRLAAPRAAGPEDVERELRCALERHDLGDHHAFVLELPGPTPGAVWARWTRGHPPGRRGGPPRLPGREPFPAERAVLRVRRPPGRPQLATACRG
jgi:hypothetical protein